jgi:DNA modification methylase
MSTPLPATIDDAVLPNTLHLGDCLEVMKRIPDGSVDMVLCDLPFGTTRCRWDVIVPFEPLWRHYKRVIKPNGAILLFGQTPFDKVLGCSNLSWLRYEWIWEKTQATGFLNAKRAPMKAHENVLVFYRKQPTYHVFKTTGHSPINSYTKRAVVQNRTTVYGAVRRDVSGGGETDRYPRSVVTFSSDKQRNKLNGTIHPTQKPLALCEYLIKVYSNEGEIVLDNCMGSGTTCLAAKNTERRYIGIERDEAYFRIAQQRVEGTAATL